MSVSVFKDQALALWTHGQKHHLRGELERAIALYTKSLGVYPTAEAYTFRGWAYSFQGRVDEAIEECKMAIAVDSTFGNPYNDIGSYLVHKGKLDEAIEWFEKAKSAPRYEPSCFKHLYQALGHKEATMVTQGNIAPDFTLETDKGAKVTLSQLRGQQIVLFFYPKDDTPGCTIECKEFRDAGSKFEGKALVFGVSADDRASHETFRDKFSLNFPLLCDLEHKMCDAYGVWGPGKWGEGIRRTTVIVAADGRIKKVFENVTPQGHAEEVLAAL